MSRTNDFSKARRDLLRAAATAGAATAVLGGMGINPALAFHPRDPVEGGRYDLHMEMSLALAAVVACGAGMAGMAGAFIPHIQCDRRESGG